MMSHCAASTCLSWRKSKNFRKTVLERVTVGRRVRFLVMDPSGPGLRTLINERAEDDTFEEIQRVLESMVEYFQKLAIEAGGNVELRLITNGCCHFNLTLVDGRAVAIQYLYGERASLSPLFDCRPESSLAESFSAEFERVSLWDANAPCVRFGSSNSPAFAGRHGPCCG